MVSLEIESLPKIKAPADADAEKLFGVFAKTQEQYQTSRPQGKENLPGPD